MSPATPQSTSCNSSPLRQGSDDRDLLTSCVHCGLCLEVCPTYQLTGDENNSPRGRLRLWREEADGRLAQDDWTTAYTEDCVGCLACESACPANVPYGEILEQVRHQHHTAGRSRPRLLLRLADALVRRPALLNLLALPARMLRNFGLSPTLPGACLPRLMFPGRPPLVQSTAAYARELMHRYRPTGPRVALLTGCLMEAVFREINFATVRVLIENNVQVTVPEGQGCCGAFAEHLGVGGVETLRHRNREAFCSKEYDAIVANSSGCGYALQKSCDGSSAVMDVLTFLGTLEHADAAPVAQRRR
ncbi:MAG: (Fe-S)-binding protein, partial [Planctomycetaceae bacterium]|nr:(Fe-S)-binding protein [Planctomycetaceae bacterium]